MKTMKSIVAAVARLCGSFSTTTRTMANAMDHKAMLYKLLGLADDAGEDMVNSRYNEAMACDADDDAKKLANATTEAVTALKASGVTVDKTGTVDVVVLAANATKTATATAANEKQRADKADADLKAEQEKVKTANMERDAVKTSFANERKERVKLLLDAKVTAGHITGAERAAFEAEFANEGAFDATLAKLDAKKATKLPAGRQAGMPNIGSRQVSPDTRKRQETVAQMVNEEMKKAVYANLDQQVKYSRAFAAVQATNPALWETGN